MAKQRKQLAKKAKRRERARLRRHREHTFPYGSDRGKAKAAAHETYLDQVTLDHEQGLELGRIARQRYREQCTAAARRREREAAMPQRRAESEPRPGDTYRGARKRLDRGTRAADVQKAVRKAQGLTRPEFDRLRWDAARHEARVAA